MTRGYSRRRRWLLGVSVVLLVLSACSDPLGAAILQEALHGLDFPKEWVVIEDEVDESTGCVDVACPSATRRYDGDLRTTEDADAAMVVIRTALVDAGFRITDTDEPCRLDSPSACNAVGERDGIRVSVTIQEPRRVGLIADGPLVITARAIDS